MWWRRGRLLAVRMSGAGGGGGCGGDKRKEPGPGQGPGPGPGPSPGLREDGQPPTKKLRSKSGRAGERYVPPPGKKNQGIVSFSQQHFSETEYYFEHGLRKVFPYYFDFQTYCKGRWVGKTMREVFSDEFRAEPLDYYIRAASAGRIRLNEQPADLDTVLKNNDFMRNTVHRHEPPVTAQPLRILSQNQEVVVVDKPASIPVHPCGRYRHNTIIFILGKEHNLTELHTIHRLDRLTSGVLMFAKTLDMSKKIDQQVRERQVQKEYVCRVQGEFPAGELTCVEPVLVVSYKVGVCRVHPDGKPCRTAFQRLSFNGHSSVVRCQPHTGRTHQIRVHLQFLGHPILNDPVYNTGAWGPRRGAGGHVGSTDEELLQALLELHRLKESPDLQPPHAGQGPPHPLEGGEQGPSTGPLDELCGECRIIRKEPTPEDLVMYLHALCYKGPDWEYSSPLPSWAAADWHQD
ncbi:pseudouridylate synthase RPUSD2 [Rhinoraja longicauda]